MADRFTHDVFLSHNSKDKPRVRRLAEALRDAGLRVWFDEWVIKPGDDIYLTIERGLETGQCQATLKGHSARVKSVQITPDGRPAVSGSEDTTVRVWDLEAGTSVGILEAHRDGVDSIAVSPDGALIGSTGFEDETVRLWDLKSGACLQVVPQDDFPLSVAFSPLGSQLVVGTVEGTIYIYRLTGVRASQPAEATRRYVNAKFVLIGEGAVGKTSLAHRLIEDRYVVRDRTHGMNVWPLDLPLPPDATIEREALLWDLAGQEDYRLIHRLFLDETALALLLINPQKDDPFAEAGVAAIGGRPSTLKPPCHTGSSPLGAKRSSKCRVIQSINAL